MLLYTLEIIGEPTKLMPYFGNFYGISYTEVESTPKSDVFLVNIGTDYLYYKFVFTNNIYDKFLNFELFEVVK